MRWMLPLLLLAVPLAARAADPAEGRRLSEQWCANCHQIARGGPGPVTDAAPGFHVIAERPGRTEEAIAAFLRTPHAGMPDHGLTLHQAQDLAAYVKAQGGAR